VDSVWEVPPDTSGIETASFKDQPESEIDRLMHMVVVGGGPTGVEYAGELHDFLIVSGGFLACVLFRTT
jgi:pyruvate/2-oxoglutarate dehydrogenase complex dihydrolipoamide dehydrogenase (E3) component